MTTLSLSADKGIVKGNETVKFTANYPGEAGKEIRLMLKGFLFNDVVVGKAITNSSGVAIISWKASTVGTFHFFAFHTDVPFADGCGIFFCDRSAEVDVSVTDAPCDPADILCTIGGGVERALTRQQIIMAVVAVIIILVLIYMYLPKKRS